MAGEQDKLLTYYQREMAYLRQMGSLFAEKHPKIAKRLDIGQGESTDPHVERLLESFAFLSGTLQRDMDAEFPRISQTLLSILYPQFVHIIPSCAVTQFQVDVKKSVPTTGYVIPQHTSLFARTAEGVTCQFQTGYDVNLWPIKIENISLVPVEDYSFSTFFTDQPQAIKIDLSPLQGSFKDLENLSQLRFFINGGNVLQHILYEAIFTSSENIGVAIGGTRDVKTCPSSLKPVGLSQKEVLLPHLLKVHPAYVLLLEYFCFPEKFFFFDVLGIQNSGADKELSIFIPVSNSESLSWIDFSPDIFLLGCSPIINSFKKISEPFRLDGLSTEYRLVPDQRREMITEINVVTDVYATNSSTPDPIALSPYFEFMHQEEQEDQKFFWIARRIPTVRPGMPGTDTNLSFVDFNFNPSVPSVDTIYAHILCTNRDLAMQIPAGAILEIENDTPSSSIICLNTPAAPLYPPQEGGVLWSLISQLCLNRISLSNEPYSLDALKSILRLYAGLGTPQTTNEIESITKMNCSYNIQRLGNEAWRNFARGTSLELTFDDRYYGGTPPLLFAMVLNHFFSLYTSINSFTQLTVYKANKPGIWKKWPPMAGETWLI